MSLYLLYSYSRRDVMALGKFALNLSGCPRDLSTEFVGHLDGLISSLVTKVCLHSLSSILAQLMNCVVNSVFPFILIDGSCALMLTYLLMHSTA